jgi:hypothetical protein
VTAVLDDPLTVAANCWVLDTVRDAVAGVTETATGGFSVTVAVADLDASATLVALTVTVCLAVIEPGVV